MSPECIILTALALAQSHETIGKGLAAHLSIGLPDSRAFALNLPDTVKFVNCSLLFNVIMSRLRLKFLCSSGPQRL